MKKQLFNIKSTIWIIALVFSLKLSAENPLWLRDISISPNGDKIAFCYKGDIYTVSVNGGEATRITSSESYEANPIWSPDSKAIAFASDRNGSFDIYITDANGGSAKRLTYDSAKEIPTAFTPDGKQVLFVANIQDPASSAMYPSASLTELYAVPVVGGKTTQVLGTPAEKVCYSPDGKFFVYQDKKGSEDEWRKHHTSSITRDIWKYDIATKSHTNLTNRAGEDRDPIVATDGKNVYMLSEVNNGSMNVWSFTIEQPSKMQQISHFTTHPVRFLTMANDMLCYTWDGEIYTQIIGQEPQKVNISLIRDDENIPELMTATKGATSASVSPNGKQVAFIVRGEVFVTSVEYPTTKQITHTAAAEYNVDFGKDNRSLVYASERDGVSQLYMAKISRSEDPNFPNATLIEEEALIPDLNIERSYPTFSPDGKEIAFIENRNKLKVVNLATKAIREVTDGNTWYSHSYGFSYEWSPDGKWFVIEYTANGHEPYNDMGIVSADGGEIHNITQSGYMSGNPHWVLDGNAVLFESEIYGYRTHASWGSENDVFLCFVNQDAYDKYRLSKEDYELVKELEKAQKSKETKTETDKKDNKKDSKKKDDKAADPKQESAEKNIVMEFDGLTDRIVRVTPNSSHLGDATISSDGENLYYLSTFEKGADLWKMDLRKYETKLIAKDAGNGAFMWDKEGKTLFLLGSTFKKIEKDALKPVSFTATYKVDHQAERDYMYDYMAKEVKERFFCEDMNGVDWDGMVEAYRRFLPHINNNYDFSELLAEVLGEMNVSHSGSGYRAAASKEPTGSLGLLFDYEYTGAGMKVAEVVTGGPFDHKALSLAAGDIITHINGKEITPETDLSELLSGQVGKKTLVSVQGKEDMVVLPITAATMRDLLYNRWVKQRAAEVERLSNGRLGYVHIKAMSDIYFRSIYSDILGKYNHCEGIVIDTRNNTGGRMHEDIEILFSGQKYLTQVIRGKESCTMPSRRWTKPSIMLQCEANYSNAHGTPWVYSHQHIGKLVGAPVPGTMSSVNWITLQDPSVYFGIPIIGYRTEEGNYLENTQLEPDILVLNTPEGIVNGEDLQLKAAVEELLKEIDSAK